MATEIKYAGQCQHGIPLSDKCEKCDKEWEDGTTNIPFTESQKEVYDRIMEMHLDDDRLKIKQLESEVAALKASIGAIHCKAKAIWHRQSSPIMHDIHTIKIECEHAVPELEGME